ncbi:hypothetical protein [Streptomyces silvensis]|nr:hypothetical protein [Streptomyces silvensis]
MTDRPTTTPTDGLTGQQSDALWDAVAIPGPDAPTFPEQHDRVCRAVAEMIAMATAVPEVVPVDDTDRVRDDLLRAIDFNFCIGPLGYASPEALLAAYDASRPAAPPAPAQIWIVWAEDSHALDHCTDTPTAQAAAIEHHRDAEGPGHEFVYGWHERDGHLELRADDVDTGLRVSRAQVHGPTAPADRDRPSWRATLREAARLVGEFTGNTSDANALMLARLADGTPRPNDPTPVNPAPPADRGRPDGTFVLWLDAPDGSVATHDGVRWPDGTATIHHRRFGYTSTHATPEAAAQAAHGKQERIVWAQFAPADRDLRDRIAEALYPTYGQEDRTRSLAIADAVLAVLPAPADRAAVLREAADWFQDRCVKRFFGTQVAVELRRMANEAQQTEPPEDTAADDLTLDEARQLVDDLGLDLYQAQDALAFVEECCVIADREGRTITTADVREWLKGARCGRQLLADRANEAQQNGTQP